MERKRVGRSILDGYTKPLCEATRESESQRYLPEDSHVPRKQPPLVCLLHSATGWEPPKGSETPPRKHRAGFQSTVAKALDPSCLLQRSERCAATVLTGSIPLLVTTALIFLEMGSFPALTPHESG